MKDLNLRTIGDSYTEYEVMMKVENNWRPGRYPNGEEIGKAKCEYHARNRLEQAEAEWSEVNVPYYDMPTKWVVIAREVTVSGWRVV